MSEKNVLATKNATEEEVANDLYQALVTKRPLTATDYEEKVANFDTAYRVQRAFTELKNEAVGGYKVSLTSEETQKMFDSDSPFYGAETTSAWLKNHATVKLSDLMDPLLEVEMVFTAKEALLATDSLAELLSKVEVSAGVELPDSRFKDWFPSLSKYLVVADGAVGGRVVYTKPTTEKVAVNDLAGVDCTLTLNGKQLGTGKSSEVLGNPLNSLQWLVKKLAEQGVDYPKGIKVSSGTFLLPPHLQTGHYVAHFSKYFEDVELDVK
ncbi:2-keto-4-pentenoate hydratase [Loigolactobacillus backii]|uniref:2-keto-4-pentenoate hydratase n=1 Tax=Loigolactobacillus backii TaxID=375175 RepID=UPI000C1C9BF6|nr:2-keto-4-pentenoate hydratase [Loigolactobacillus backii]MDA5388431.1 2-keto-4-pentenoate hydratase [Loigolactobacillus backii]MDA5390928.1 2-keto-4-pentenoate hydratase [Loigolactobacillus backii]PIO84216.1 2-keto-4-pentenoate hydratase [Loigolactobacillus backii]